MKNLLIIGLGILTFSCSSIRVFSDFDNSVNFDNYKSFAFFKPGIEEVEISDLDKRRILKSIEQSLEEKNLVLSSNPGKNQNASRMTKISSTSTINQPATAIQKRGVLIIDSLPGVSSNFSSFCSNADNANRSIILCACTGGRSSATAWRSSIKSPVEV